jgi:hypothetical protein
MADNESVNSPSELVVHIAEVMAGVCFACLLTLCFMEKLDLWGHFAMVSFAVALPALLVYRFSLDPVAAENLGQQAVRAVEQVGNWANAMVTIGFFALLMQVYKPAAIGFIICGGLFGCFIVYIAMKRPQCEQLAVVRLLQRAKPAFLFIRTTLLTLVTRFRNRTIGK